MSPVSNKLTLGDLILGNSLIEDTITNNILLRLPFQDILKLEQTAKSFNPKKYWKVLVINERLNFLWSGKNINEREQCLLGKALHQYTEMTSQANKTVFFKEVVERFPSFSAYMWNVKISKRLFGSKEISNVKAYPNPSTIPALVLINRESITYTDTEMELINKIPQNVLTAYNSWLNSVGEEERPPEALLDMFRNSLTYLELKRFTDLLTKTSEQYRVDFFKKNEGEMDKID